MTYRHLFFDFDGVIVDSFDLSYAAHNAVTPQPRDLAGYKAMFHGNIYKHDNEEDETEAVKESMRQDPFFVVYTPKLMQTPPVVGIHDALQALSSQTTLAIVSSSITSPIQEYLDKYDLAEHFDTVLGADIHRSKVRKMKMLCELYAVSPAKCLFVTDTLGDMREAKKAGLPAVGVSWGFHDEQTLLEGEPLHIVKTPAELASVIMSL